MCAKHGGSKTESRFSGRPCIISKCSFAGSSVPQGLWACSWSSSDFFWCLVRMQRLQQELKCPRFLHWLPLECGIQLLGTRTHTPGFFLQPRSLAATMRPPHRKSSTPNLTAARPAQVLYVHQVKAPLPGTPRKLIQAPSRCQRAENM